MGKLGFGKASLATGLALGTKGVVQGQQYVDKREFEQGRQDELTKRTNLMERQVNMAEKDAPMNRASKAVTIAMALAGAGKGKEAAAMLNAHKEVLGLTEDVTDIKSSDEYMIISLGQGRAIRYNRRTGDYKYIGPKDSGGLTSDEVRKQILNKKDALGIIAGRWGYGEIAALSEDADIKTMMGAMFGNMAKNKGYARAKEILQSDYRTLDNNQRAEYNQAKEDMIQMNELQEQILQLAQGTKVYDEVKSKINTELKALVESVSGDIVPDADPNVIGAKGTADQAANLESSLAGTAPPTVGGVAPRQASVPRSPEEIPTNPPTLPIREDQEANILKAAEGNKVAASVMTRALASMNYYAQVDPRLDRKNKEKFNAEEHKRLYDMLIKHYMELESRR